MESNFIKLKTSSPSGDLISFLSGIKQLHNDLGKKAVIYHRLNMEGNSYEGAVHPYLNEDSVPICFNKYAFDMMKPLLLSQDYIEDYVVYNGQEYDLDLDKIRLETFTNQPKGSLNRWPFYVFPQMATDLSRPWIKILKGYSNKIIINYTKRHRNPYITYFFLKKYENNIAFVGLKEEHEHFCKQWGLDIEYKNVTNFYELSQIIAGSVFFAGCQSFCFQLAEAMKIPRILEIFPLLPNVIPSGGEAYDAYHQGAIEYYFDKLCKEKL